MKRQPTFEEASEAEHWLEKAILEFSNEARAPWERDKPNPDPLWKPRRSTFRYSPLRGGGFIYSMDANDPQIVAYYVTPVSGTPFGRVTAHGQARAGWHTLLQERRIFPTQTPWTEWHDYRKRYDLDTELWKIRPRQ